MVPGYTGVIPKGQHYFGCRYALASRHAIDDFQRDQSQLHKQSMEMRRTAELQRDPALRGSMTSSQHTTPLMARSEYPETYVTDFARQHTESAFLLPPGHPDKRLATKLANRTLVTSTEWNVYILENSFVPICLNKPK